MSDIELVYSLCRYAIFDRQPIGFFRNTRPGSQTLILTWWSIFNCMILSFQESRIIWPKWKWYKCPAWFLFSFATSSSLLARYGIWHVSCACRDIWWPKLEQSLLRMHFFIFLGKGWKLQACLFQSTFPPSCFSQLGCQVYTLKNCDAILFKT
jgi:hypothetical protein